MRVITGPGFAAMWPPVRGIESQVEKTKMTAQHEQQANLAEKNVRRVELGTGSVGYQLTYYQRHGFRVAAVVKDHFWIFKGPIYPLLRPVVCVGSHLITYFYLTNL